jgi:hypothetical protein
MASFEFYAKPMEQSEVPLEDLRDLPYLEVSGSVVVGGPAH